MTTPYEDFVNIALGKALSADVTLPTADDIPVFTGIGRQVTGKTKAELGLATSSQLTDKADLVDGLVPASQLPGYVDDVLEYANLASFPLLGEASKLYIAIDTKLVYRWGGSTYAVTSPSLALGDTTTTAYYGDKGKIAYDHSQATGNPHNLPAASTSTDGYLTSTDWNTFNGKQAALGNVITANTYGSSTQYPIVTVNAKGIVTGITLQTVPTPTFTDATFAVQKDGSPSISATWSLTAFTESHVHTYPNKDINFGNMSFIATTDSNTLSGTGCRIEGGNNNNVSGTGSSSHLSSYQTITGTNNHAVFCRPISGTGVFTHRGDGNTYYNHRHDGNRLGSPGSNCTFYDCYGIVGGGADVNVVYRSAGMNSGVTLYGFIPHTQVTGNGVSDSPLRALCMLQSPPTLTGVPAVLVSLVAGAVIDKPPLFRNRGLYGSSAYHDIVLNAYETEGYSNPRYMLCLRRQVTVYQDATTPVISVTTLGTDLNPSNLTFTVSVSVVNSYRMQITVTATDPVSPAPPKPLTYVWSAVVESTYF